MVFNSNFTLLLPVSLLLLLTGWIQRIYGEEVGNIDSVEIGSCFKERKESGNCFGLLSKAWSKTECCQNKGFFVNRLISELEYLTDHLMHGSGTPFCVDACYEDVIPTCVGYKCAVGHTCRLVNEQPKCVCQLNCKKSDHQTGPICSSDLRKFENLCLFKKAVCLFPLDNLEEVPCPPEEVRCAPDSVFPGYCLEYVNPSDLRNKRLEQDEQRPTSLSEMQLDPILENELGRHIWKLGMSLFNKRSSTYHMRRRKMTGRFVVDATRQMHKRSGGVSFPKNLHLGKASMDGKHLHCPAGQYCLVRQYDSRPACIPLAPTEKVILSGCPEEAIFPEPMCGVDNQTYTDACQLRATSLKRQLEVRMAYRGPCREDAKCSSVRCPRDEMTCRPHHKTGQPVCLDCNDLPRNCNAYVLTGSKSEKQRDRLGKRRHPDALGDPRWNEVTITFGWPAVCGSNGRTYINTCFLHVFNCFSLEFVDLSKPGLCPGLLQSPLIIELPSETATVGLQNNSSE